MQVVLTGEDIHGQPPEWHVDYGDSPAVDIVVAAA